jgi:hypothetical protein
MTRGNRDQGLLDRVKARVPPPADALPRVHARRRAKARRARVAAGVVGLALAVGIVGTVILASTSDHETRLRPANHGQTALLVAEPGEYYYMRIARYMPSTGNGRVDTKPNVTEIWVGPDDSGRVVNDDSHSRGDQRFAPGEFPAQLHPELSTDPETLLQQLIQRGAPGGASPNPIATSSPGRSQETTTLIRSLQDLLNLGSDAFLTPEQTAAVFEAAQRLDEVTTETGVTDPLGRPAVRLSFVIDYNYRSGSTVEWYFEPETDQYMGELWVNQASQSVTSATLIESAGIASSLEGPPGPDSSYVPEGGTRPTFVRP